MFGQGLQGFLGDSSVSGHQEGVQGFQNGDFSTQASPDRTQFQTDDASTDNAQALRYRLEFQGACGIDDDVLVDRSRRNVDRTRAGSQNHILGFDDFGGAVSLGDFDFLASQQFAVALDRSNAVGLEQGGNAAGQVLDDASLAANHRGDVHFDFAGGDTVDVEALFGFLVLPGAVQQRLGRNATHVQAGTAEGQFAFAVSVLLDTGSAQTELRGLDSSYVAARTCANHYHVEFLGHKRFLLASSHKLQAARRPASEVKPVACSLQLFFRCPAADEPGLPAGS
ncbi:hypothetical protein D3C77_188320 [compost metagenome]